MTAKGRNAAPMTITVDEFEVADPADAWTRAGFNVDSDAVCRIGGVGIRLVGRGRGTGIVGWSLRGLPPDSSLEDLDGVPTTRSGAVTAVSGTHPNGVIAIDHVVLLSPDLGRTVDSLASIGVNPRRERDGELGGRPIRQIFFHGTGHGRGAARSQDHHAAQRGTRDVGPDGVDLGTRESLSQPLDRSAYPRAHERVHRVRQRPSDHPHRRRMQTQPRARRMGGGAAPT
jgi:hypothetical protein